MGDWDGKRLTSLSCKLRRVSCEPQSHAAGEVEYGRWPNTWPSAKLMAVGKTHGQWPTHGRSANTLSFGQHMANGLSQRS